MATFSFNTTGSITYLPSNLSASQAVTWSITESNPGTSYFTLETFPNSDGQYSSSSPKNTSGSFTYNSGITNVVYDDYKMSAVVKQGGGELYFIPAVPITGSDLRVRGVGGKPSFNALLDRWPNAAAAYSLRRLNSYYDGPAVRVRRSIDDQETDINFTGTSLDITALESFCSGGDGYVKTWYDQSGNGNHASQTVAANQPTIVTGSVTVVENGKPALSFNGVNNVFDVDITNISQPISSIAVSRIDYLNGDASHYIYDNENRMILGHFGGATDNFAIYSQTILDSSVTINSNQNSLFAVHNSTNSIISVNAIISSGDSGTNGITQNFKIGDRWNITATRARLKGSLSELVLWNSNQSSNRPGIESDINSHYKIY